MDAAAWATILLADRDLIIGVERWFSDTFNTVSDAYTKAMDGRFADGLQAGADYVSPSLHRIFEGHSLSAGWEAVRSAFPDDSAAEEFTAYVRSMASDMASVIGLPVSTMTRDGYEAIRDAFAGFGVPEAWLIDALHFNAVEAIAASIPALAGLLNWNKAETEQFSRLVGSSGVAAAAAGNPLMALVFVVMLARSFTKARRTGSYTSWAKALANGGVMSALVLICSSIVAGPVWVGLVVGILVATIANAKGDRIPVGQVAAMVGRVLRRGGFTSRGPEAASA